MLQITEDTPPDMLAGAMDLTVHLPTGRAVKMSVERSTPMMDLLVQITTHHHLHLSNYTLQALGMAPSSEYSDKILPFKPNTPIGALDTQHVRVLPKSRSIPVPKNIPPGHQPFESTFRLKVHLPRNQLYVTRVSRNVLLEDIMKKVCEEKNLDPTKYEFKHTGNLDEVLDPKLTLSDYQITEIYVVQKGTSSLNQAFSSTDIMTLRKEEERKQMHNKTGGGVFNLIFRRGKSSMGSGSVSSDNRSISPTHSDDSRSVTPPTVPETITTPAPKKEPPPERPKPPQRKRRPAPKPPQSQSQANSRKNSTEKPPSNISDVTSEVQQAKKVENGLTICHSRNSSDSSGYHEASILSDNCNNASLPRRPKSAFVGSEAAEKIFGEHSQSTTNLSKMSLQSKSTTSLVAGRKKKAAPPPPPVVSAANSVITLEKPSPLVASQPAIQVQPDISEVRELLTLKINPIPLPRTRSRPASAPLPPVRTSRPTSPRLLPEGEINNKINNEKDELNRNIVDEILQELHIEEPLSFELEQIKNDQKLSTTNYDSKEIVNVTSLENKITNPEESEEVEPREKKPVEINQTIRIHRRVSQNKNEQSIEESVIQQSHYEKRSNHDNSPLSHQEHKTREYEDENSSLTLQSDMMSFSSLTRLQTSTHKSIFESPEFTGEPKPPEVVAMIPKTPKEDKKFTSKFDSFGKKRCFQIGTSILEHNFDVETSSTHSKKSNDSKSGMSSRNSVSSALNAFEFVDEISDVDDNLFTGSLSKGSAKKKEIFSQLYGMHEFEKDDISVRKNYSVGSLRSITSVPGFNSSNMKKWSNVEDLDDISLSSLGIRNRWVAGDASDTESLLSPLTAQTPPINNLEYENAPVTSSIHISSTSTLSEAQRGEDKSLESSDSGIAQDTFVEKSKEIEGELKTESSISPPLKTEELTQPDNIPHETFFKDPKQLTEIQLHAPEARIIKQQAKEGPRNTTLPTSSIDIPTVKPSKELPKTPASTPIIAAPITFIEHEIPKPIEIEINTHPGNNYLELNDIDWHYQLPSPPKAFRDASPSTLINNDAPAVSEFHTDSVVTSPELFEKLKVLEDGQSVKTLMSSESTSVVSEEEKPLNKLSLENLEKRQSLVYNRELATSLKMTDNLDVSNINKETFSSSLTKFESTFEDLSRSSAKQFQTTATHHSLAHTIPNFKISTYDVPKQKIKVFEDDTVRSNTAQIDAVSDPIKSDLNKQYVGHSMENISFRKNSLESHHFEDEKKEKEYTFYRPHNTVPHNPALAGNFGPVSMVTRSESFSTDQSWSPTRPVSRSKSQLTLNKYRDEMSRRKSEDAVSKSNSLFDVSGLQSLGVMKRIQDKLNTPTTSMENLHQTEKLHIQTATTNVEVLKEKNEPPEQVIPVDTKPTQQKIYHYRGPPSINMGTWSDRPKIPVSVKEDQDYKLGNHNISSKLIVNTTNNNITSNNFVEVKNSVSSQINDTESKSVSIKVNGTTQEFTHQKPTGNVVIKIGGNQHQNFKPLDNQRFINHTTPAGYRKPFSTISSNSTNVRPHSVAFDSDFDISRVPVVRSVEFKKTFKDIPHVNNTSVTQINHGNGLKAHTLNRNLNASENIQNGKPSSMYRSNEALPTSSVKSSMHQVESHPQPTPAFRVNSFKSASNSNAPIVRGFKNSNDITNNRLSWNPQNYSTTLPSNAKLPKDFTTNRDVPFSRFNLRRTDSSNLKSGNFENNNHISTSSARTTTDLIKNERNNSYNSLPTVNKEITGHNSLPMVNKETTGPPPPPQMPKFTLKKVVTKQTPVVTVDARDQLLESIRNFGGKKGFKAGKA